MNLLFPIPTPALSRPRPERSRIRFAGSALATVSRPAFSLASEMQRVHGVLQEHFIGSHQPGRDARRESSGCPSSVGVISMGLAPLPVICAAGLNGRFPDVLNEYLSSPALRRLIPILPITQTSARNNVARRFRFEMPRKCWASSPQLQSKTDPNSGEQRIGIMVRHSRIPSPKPDSILSDARSMSPPAPGTLTKEL